MFSWTRTALRRTIIVNLDTGRAFRGIAWARRGRLLILRDATMFEPGAEPAPVDGEVVIDRDRVEFMQVMP
jgi:hypothetical protein